jgi:hypothetical protein
MSMEKESATTTGAGQWRNALAHRRFLFEGVVTLLALVTTTYLCKEVMHYAHTRPGVPINDPILNAIGPFNLRWPIFIVLWSSLLLGVCSLVKTPQRLLVWLQAAAVLFFLRAIALYLVPLEPFPTIIPLADPIATIRSNSGDLITEDLFFSGHTAIMFLLFLAMVSSRLKGLLLAGTVFISIGVVLQHVHYSGDVFSAPFFAYGSWRLVLFAHKIINNSALTD